MNLQKKLKICSITVNEVLICGFMLTIFLLIVALYIFSLRSSFIRHENGIVAQYKENQNVYDNYFKTVKEVAQVPKEYAKELKSVFDSAIKGRCGNDGCKNQWLFIKEHNPNFDSSMFKEIQAVISAGRAKFSKNQKILIDKKLVYENARAGLIAGLVANMFAFPRINLSEFDIVTSDHTEQTFMNKKSESLKVFD
jgi:hypothetical protein